MRAWDSFQKVQSVNLSTDDGILLTTWHLILIISNLKYKWYHGGHKNLKIHGGSCLHFSFRILADTATWIRPTCTVKNWVSYLKNKLKNNCKKYQMTTCSKLCWPCASFASQHNNDRWRLTSTLSSWLLCRYSKALSRSPLLLYVFPRLL